MKTFWEMLGGGGQAFDLQVYPDNLAVGPLVGTYTLVTTGGHTLSFYMPVSGPIKAGEMWDIRYELAWQANHVNCIDSSEIRIGLTSADERDGFAVASQEGSFNVNPNTNQFGLIQRRAIHVFASALEGQRFVKAFLRFASTGATGGQTVTVIGGFVNMLRYIPR